MTELPRKSLELIEELWDNTGKSPILLIDEYWTAYNDPFIQSDPMFRNDAERHAYVRGILRTQYEYINVFLCVEQAITLFNKKQKMWRW